MAFNLMKIRRRLEQVRSQLDDARALMDARDEVDAIARAHALARQQALCDELARLELMVRYATQHVLVESTEHLIAEIRSVSHSGVLSDGWLAFVRLQARENLIQPHVRDYARSQGIRVTLLSKAALNMPFACYGIALSKL